MVSATSDNRSNSRANTCNKPRLLEGMHLLDKRSTRALPVATMIHDNSTDRTALVPATHHSNFCPINFRWASLVPAAAVCTGLLVPSVGDALLALTGRVVASGAVTLKKLECSKQAYALDSRGHSYFIVRGEILGFMKDEQLRKHLPRMFSLIKNESWGARRRSDTVLVSTINDADQGSADVAF
ncbi:hypothetical protein L1887_57634 [Cichorium endivia]|nr:hypothetical protein L1887_57634 [Cichorium endivia]